jgi:hypothetical protein
MQERGELASQETGKYNLPNNEYDTDVRLKTLADIGLSCKESSRFQKVADSKHLIPYFIIVE